MKSNNTNSYKNRVFKKPVKQQGGCCACQYNAYEITYKKVHAILRFKCCLKFSIIVKQHNVPFFYGALTKVLFFFDCTSYFLSNFNL